MCTANALWCLHALSQNYKKTGKKERSGPALYKLAAVDLVRTGSTNLEKTFEHISPVLGESVPGTNVPYSFVVTANLPQEEPKLFSTPGKGPSYVIIFHFVASSMLLKQLNDLDSASPAVKLFNNFCSEGLVNSNFMGRFKAMCIIDDIGKHGFPAIVNRFNGKPVLINKSGRLNAFYQNENGALAMGVKEGKDVNALNMLINVHLFAFVARKTLFSLYDKFKDMALNIAFTIEGRADEELPEVVLGCAKLEGIEVGDKMALLDGT